MTKISFSFSDLKEIFRTEEAIQVVLIEKEGKLPKLEVTLPIKFLWEADQATMCSMLIDDTIVFNGRIVDTSFNSFSLVLTIQGEEVQKIHRFDNDYPEYIKTFIADNSEILSNTEVVQRTKTGEVKNVSLITPSETIDIEPLVLEDSVVIKKSTSSVVKKLGLNLFASWVKSCDGSLDLSLKIANKFKGGQINTLTPYKLMDSWPMFGDRVSGHQNAKQTKYSIGHSKLIQDLSQSSKTNDIEISEDIPKFSLKREFFDNKLILSWNYDQYMTEILSLKINNSRASKGVDKEINLNLGNVQECIEDTDDDSFLGGAKGRNLLEYIFKMVGNYIILSHRNIKISFTIPFQDDPGFMKDLGVDKWIKIKGFIAKITNIEYKISNLERLIKIKARAFEEGARGLHEELKPPIVALPEKRSFGFEDVIYDINVENEADSQWQKFVNYIEDLKFQKKIDKNNYKSLISKFLHENQTKINIIANPLKKSNFERREIKIEEPLCF